MHNIVMGKPLGSLLILNAHLKEAITESIRLVERPPLSYLSGKASLAIDLKCGNRKIGGQHRTVHNVRINRLPIKRALSNEKGVTHDYEQD